ncbi:DUF6074 family protein [Arvimicrobium flavum]|uniref:DUF6074 family protein n=1 Tax=Arvimicrobium flavum TaxID=3393320 RepID=UPI00237B6027|nr:DUF6074 family protein [Mesorhizobium shangrilense]
MAQLIPFPLRSRVSLADTIATDLETLHGPAANDYWRTTIAKVVADLRRIGLSQDAIREEVLDLQDNVQAALQNRMVASGGAA